MLPPPPFSRRPKRWPRESYTLVRRANGRCAVRWARRGRASVSMKSGKDPGQEAGQPLSIVIGGYCKPPQRFQDGALGPWLLVPFPIRRQFFLQAVPLTERPVLSALEFPSSGYSCAARAGGESTNFCRRTEHTPLAKILDISNLSGTLSLNRRSRFVRFVCPSPTPILSSPPSIRYSVRAIAFWAGLVGDQRACQNGMPHERPRHSRIRTAWTYAERRQRSTDGRPLMAGLPKVGRQPSPHPPSVAGRLQWLATSLTWSSHAVPSRPSTPFPRTTEVCPCFRPQTGPVCMPALKWRRTRASTARHQARKAPPPDPC